MVDSYAVPEAPIGGHLYRQQVGVKVILASMQQKVGISVSALCAGGSKSDFGEHPKKGGNKRECTMCALCVHSVCALCALCVHDVCTMYARRMHDVCTMDARVRSTSS